jgi:preprotein translocase subunit SecG
MGGSSSGSTAIVEKNLTRATIIASILFALTTYALDHLLK